MKLTEDQYNEIAEKYKNGLSQEKIAKEYGVSQGTIWNILNRKAVKCERCGKEYLVTPGHFKTRKTGYCYNCSSIQTLTGTTRMEYRGILHPRWKGGSYISKYGYKVIKTDKLDKNRKQIYTAEQILVFENETGRKLKTSNKGTGEQIHHIDGDKLNNNISNLEFCSDPKDHILLHKQLEELAFEMVREGLIIFDKTTRKYYKKDKLNDQCFS